MKTINVLVAALLLAASLGLSVPAAMADDEEGGVYVPKTAADWPQGNEE